MLSDTHFVAYTGATLIGGGTIVYSGPTPPPDVPLGTNVVPATSTSLTVLRPAVEAGEGVEVMASVTTLDGGIATGHIAFVCLDGRGNWIVNPATGQWQHASLLAMADLDANGQASAVLTTEAPGRLVSTTDTSYVPPMLDLGSHRIAAVYLGSSPIVVAEGGLSSYSLESTLSIVPRTGDSLIWTNNRPFRISFEQYSSHKVEVSALGGQQAGMLFAEPVPGSLSILGYYGAASSLPLVITGTGWSSYQGGATQVSMRPARTLGAEGDHPSSVSGSVSVDVQATVGLEIAAPAISTTTFMQPIIARFLMPDGSYFRSDKPAPQAGGSTYSADTVLNIQYASTGPGSLGAISITNGYTPPVQYEQGVVTFMEGDVVLGTARMTIYGQAVFTPSQLSVGDHVITASFSGSTRFREVAAEAITLKVRVNSVVGTLGYAYTSGSRLALTARTWTQYLDSVVPTGSITFYDGDRELGTVGLRSKSDVFVPLDQGTRQLHFRYSGDDNYAAFDSEMYHHTLGATSLHPVPLTISGTAGDDVIGVAVASDDVRYLRVNVNDESFLIAPGEISELRIMAGDGNDFVTIGAGVRAATIDGGNGDDSILGGDGADLIYGGAGQDTIRAGGGADSVYGNTGDDLIEGGIGRDLLCGGLGNDVIAGDGGADSIYGGDGTDLLLGGGGADYIEGRGKADTIYGGAGNDAIYGQAGNDVIYGEDGDDAIYVADGAGSPFRDTVYTGVGVDLVERDLLDSVYDSVQTLA